MNIAACRSEGRLSASKLETDTVPRVGVSIGNQRQTSGLISLGISNGIVLIK